MYYIYSIIRFSTYYERLFSLLLNFIIQYTNMIYLYSKQILQFVTVTCGISVVFSDYADFLHQ